MDTVDVGERARLHARRSDQRAHRANSKNKNEPLEKSHEKSPAARGSRGEDCTLQISDFRFWIEHSASRMHDQSFVASRDRQSFDLKSEI
jgi:hypothetical protein